MIDEVVANILASKKYKDIAPMIIERVCKKVAKKYVKKKDVLKATKSELHTIHEVFLLKDSHKNATTLLSMFTKNCDMAQLCAKMMQLHVSTKERLGDIEDIYQFISEYVKSDSIVIDIGCGFSPFALPLLHEQPKSYMAYDVNIETIHLLNRYFSQTGQEQYQAEILDAVSDTPSFEVDMVFMFKLLPLLQQQKKGRGFSILEELSFKRAIVSFPLKSISGKDKGMASFYSKLMDDNLPASINVIDKAIFSNEMFYVLEKVAS